MRYSELEKLIKQAGCYILKEGANHSIWYSPITQKNSRWDGTGRKKFRREPLNQSKRRRGSSDPRLPRHLKGD